MISSEQFYYFFNKKIGFLLNRLQQLLGREIIYIKNKNKPPTLPNLCLEWSNLNK